MFSHFWNTQKRNKLVNFQKQLSLRKCPCWEYLTQFFCYNLLVMFFAVLFMIIMFIIFLFWLIFPFHFVFRIVFMMLFYPLNSEIFHDYSVATEILSKSGVRCEYMFIKSPPSLMKYSSLLLVYYFYTWLIWFH